MLRLIQADVTQGIPLPDESVHCVCCSPPYWGLRDYQVEGQLGLEKTPEEYVERMVGVFREVRRVLRSDGVCFVNMGDAFNEKQLIGQPWRLAFALQADGWYLRSDIIWAKPNPMPESVRDRPTKSHEYVFLFSRSPRYFWDQEAVRENGAEPERTRNDTFGGASWRERNQHSEGGQSTGHVSRNLRTVWTIATQGFPGAHFATYPEELPRRCILAGSPTKVCAECGKGWERVVERGELEADEHAKKLRPSSLQADSRSVRDKGWSHEAGFMPNARYSRQSTGFRPACDCNAGTDLATILDPFAGSGTTVQVAANLGRHGVGLELNEEYLKLARKRCSTQQGLSI